MSAKRHHEIAGKERHLSGWRRDREDHRDFKLSVPLTHRFLLTPRLSLKGNKALVVEDQGEIGSCTANSSTTALEFELAGKGIIVQLSRLYLYARSRQFEGTPLSEDSGCEIRDAIKVLAKMGDVLEKDWPYDTSKFTVNPPAKLDVEAQKYRPTSYYACPTILQIKSSISSGHPVVGGFQVPSNMMSEACAKTGVVKEPMPGDTWEGGHAVLFTGYDDIKRLLQFQNSWGTKWGDGGYGYLPYSFVTKGYADDFWTLRYTPPAPPTPPKPVK